MKTKIQKSILSIFVVFALVVGCFAAMPPTNAGTSIKDNENQDFTDTPVSVIASNESVLVGEETQIVVTIENIADRGLPDVSILVDGECINSYDEIGKGETVEYVIDVDTSEVGTQDFKIKVWTRLGNKNFGTMLYSQKITIAVTQPIVEEKPLEDKFNDAIKNGDVSGIGPIVLTVDGVDYSFTSNSGNYNGYGSLFCTVDGVVYRLERNNNGLIGVFVN
jgi:hypothetical protein